MTMHMVHPGLTTLNTGKKKQRPSVKQVRAAAAHDEWLRSQGLHTEQLSERLPKKPRKLKSSYQPNPLEPQCGNGFAPAGAKKSVFDSEWKRTYDDDPAMAEREVLALAKAEALKGNLMPLYNKGPVQLNTNLSSLKDGNGRGRR